MITITRLHRCSRTIRFRAAVSCRRSCAVRISAICSPRSSVIELFDFPSAPLVDIISGEGIKGGCEVTIRLSKVAQLSVNRSVTDSPVGKIALNPHELAVAVRSDAVDRIILRVDSATIQFPP